jgi:hypothetical protein
VTDYSVFIQTSDIDQQIKEVNLLREKYIIPVCFSIVGKKENMEEI